MINQFVFESGKNVVERDLFAKGKRMFQKNASTRKKEYMQNKGVPELLEVASS